MVWRDIVEMHDGQPDYKLRYILDFLIIKNKNGLKIKCIGRKGKCKVKCLFIRDNPISYLSWFS